MAITVQEAIDLGIRRVYDPIYHKQYEYLVLPKKRKDNSTSNYCYFFKPSNDSPITISLASLTLGLNTIFEEYKDKISTYDLAD
jgi:hypothetical protein